MRTGSGVSEYAGGAVWRSAEGVEVIVIATPSGFVLGSWPARKGMLTHMLPDGRWEFGDRHLLAEALEGWTFVGYAGTADDPDRC